MAFLSVKDLSIEFRVYGPSARSLKKKLLRQFTGGRVAREVDDHIVIRALQDISLEIKDGDHIGLVGPNGSGKSTLLRAMAGIYKPSRGSIELQGKIGTLMNIPFGMDPESTGTENIYLRGYLLGMNKNEINSKFKEIAEFADIGDFLDLPIKTYSQGMLYRLSFSISTSIRPEILLIDEAIGASDPKFLEKTIQKSNKLWHDARIAVLASHDINILSAFADELIYLEKGRIVKRKKIKK